MSKKLGTYTVCEVDFGSGGYVDSASQNMVLEYARPLSTTLPLKCTLTHNVGLSTNLNKTVSIAALKCRNCSVHVAHNALLFQVYIAVPQSKHTVMGKLFALQYTVRDRVFIIPDTI